MQRVAPQTKTDRLERVLNESWDVLTQRIASGRVKINKEASLQLHYSSIVQGFGEICCIEPGETFVIELETGNERKSIDLTCTLGDVKAAVELKCFRKASNRAVDTDMYDVLRDIERLLSYKDFAVRKFICLTDNIYYVNGAHSGHAGTVTIRDGTVYKEGSTVAPGWAGKWKNATRDRGITFSKTVAFDWRRTGAWYSLFVTV